MAKLLKIFFTLLIFIQSLICFGQTSETLGLRRIYMNIIPAVVLESNGEKVSTGLGGSYGGTDAEVGGVQLEVGNHWAFSKNNVNTGFFRFTWTKVGIHNYGFLLAPAQVGLGIHKQFSPKTSVEFSLNGGLFFATDDMLYPELESDFAIYPHMRFNFQNFSLGLEYSYKRNYKDVFSLRFGYHYFGLIIGHASGKRIN